MNHCDFYQLEELLNTKFFFFFTVFEIENIFECSARSYQSLSLVSKARLISNRARVTI